MLFALASAASGASLGTYCSSNSFSATAVYNPLSLAVRHPADVAIVKADVNLLARPIH